MDLYSSQDGYGEYHLLLGCDRMEEDGLKRGAGQKELSEPVGSELGCVLKGSGRVQLVH